MYLINMFSSLQTALRNFNRVVSSCVIVVSSVGRSSQILKYTLAVKCS